MKKPSHIETANGFQEIDDKKKGEESDNSPVEFHGRTVLARESAVFKVFFPAVAAK